MEFGIKNKEFMLAQVDSAGSPQYFGYEAKDGSWYISQNTNGAWRYSKGASGFSTAWTGRAGLTYDYPSAIW